MNAPIPIIDTMLSYQSRVRDWVVFCFGIETADHNAERGHRFLEEAIELAQANGATRADAHELVDYVFNRPIGEPHQEVGGVMVTLAGLCAAKGIDMSAEAERELARVWTKVDAIRLKNATKPRSAPLPGSSPPAGGEYGMAWNYVGPTGRPHAGTADGGTHPWDWTHAADLVARMNDIYGAGTHRVVAVNS